MTDLESLQCLGEELMPFTYSITEVCECTCSIAWIVITKHLSDFIVS